MRNPPTAEELGKIMITSGAIAMSETQTQQR